MLKWIINAVMKWLAGSKSDAAAAKAEAAAAEARRQATQDRVQADEQAQQDTDPRATLQRDWRRSSAVVLVAAALGLAACAQDTLTRVSVVDTGCDWAKPIYVADQDQLTQETARAILAHNTTWRTRCDATKRRD